MKTKKEIIKERNKTLKIKKEEIKQSKCICEREYQKAYFTGFCDALDWTIEEKRGIER